MRRRCAEQTRRKTCDTKRQKPPFVIVSGLLWGRGVVLVIGMRGRGCCGRNSAAPCQNLSLVSAALSPHLAKITNYSNGDTRRRRGALERRLNQDVGLHLSICRALRPSPLNVKLLCSNFHRQCRDPVWTLLAEILEDLGVFFVFFKKVDSGLTSLASSGFYLNQDNYLRLIRHLVIFLV